MISTILRWSGKTLLAFLLLLVLVIVAFRMAASIRETRTRAELAPSWGHLVPTNSGGVFVQERGPANGIPVVPFHGTAAWSELWRHTTPVLADAGFHVIALDLPPFGFSDRPGSYTRQDQAARQRCAHPCEGRARHHRRPFLWRRPHPDSVTPPGKQISDVTPLFQIDDGRLLNQLPAWAPDAAIRKKILVDNPALLYGF